MWTLPDGYSVDKDLTVNQTVFCELQGTLFEYSQYEGFNAEEFVTEFLSWELVKDIDEYSSPVQYWGDAQMFRAIDIELKLGRSSERMVSDLTMFWIGYITRYWTCWLGTYSKEIITKVSFKKLCGYDIFHTMGNEEAIARILKFENFKPNGRYLTPC